MFYIDLDMRWRTVISMKKLNFISDLEQNLNSLFTNDGYSLLIIGIFFNKFFFIIEWS